MRASTQVREVVRPRALAPAAARSHALRVYVGRQVPPRPCRRFRWRAEERPRVRTTGCSWCRGRWEHSTRPDALTVEG